MCISPPTQSAGDTANQDTGAEPAHAGDDQGSHGNGDDPGSHDDESDGVPGIGEPPVITHGDEHGAEVAMDGAGATEDADRSRSRSPARAPHRFAHGPR